ncbi:MAG TPA: type II toxin-antitoxin system RelE/ParE family toxin [bacterium]|nr:type II toxin-antitoxin system RelE/ParE family toxin [bacterium]
MIKTFASRETELLFVNGTSRRLPSDIVRVALRKLDYLNAAATVNDLRVPPGNRLEALRGDRKGRYSIRINDQFRLVFRFESGDAYDVEIVDYH